MRIFGARFILMKTGDQYRSSIKEEEAMGFGREESGRASGELVIFMGKGVSIKGDIHFEGSGRLDGKVEGKIQVDGSLILGDGAMVASEIKADTIIVGGNVKGKIIARKKVQLLKTSVVNCDISSPSLVVEEGALFNGSSRMGNAEAATAPVSIVPPESPKKIVGLAK